jgi:hypothetical protein
MPDEDPPERGLADLMAAARVKAETMATPSLWQRCVDAMRRPPVLALATVMVLIGGAALISNRSKGMDAQPTISATQEGAARDEAREEGQASSAGSAAAMPAPTTTLSPDVVGNSAPMAEPSAEEAKPTSPPMKRPESSGPRGGDSPKMKTATSATAKAEPVDSPKTTSKLDRERDDDSLPESDGEAEKKETKATVTETRPHGGVTAGAQAPLQTDSSALATSSADLHQMARKLVAKGDCKSAQTLTTRIAKQDPAYYKAKVVPDRTFDRCVLAQ